MKGSKQRLILALAFLAGCVLPLASSERWQGTVSNRDPAFRYGQDADWDESDFSADMPDSLTGPDFANRIEEDTQDDDDQPKLGPHDIRLQTANCWETGFDNECIPLYEPVE